MKPTIKTVDRTDEINKTIRRFRNDMVLVGIPEAETKRDDSGPITNAALLAINEFGSPANNIPSRPVMKIGIRNAQDEIAAQFKSALLNAFKSGISALSIYYNRAGLIASNSIKKVINAQEGIEAPAESTIKAREAKGFKGTKALIVTGQMRNSITYVVKGGG